MRRGGAALAPGLDQLPGQFPTVPHDGENRAESLGQSRFEPGMGQDEAQGVRRSDRRDVQAHEVVRRQQRRVLADGAWLVTTVHRAEAQADA